MNAPPDFADIYLKHRSRVTRYVRYRCRPDEVEDAVQETFLQAWAGWHRASTLTDIVGWLLWNARNVLLNMRRAASRMCRKGETVDVDDVVIASPAKQGLALYVDQLQRHFSGLGPAQHQAIAMVSTGATNIEIAEATGKTQQNVAMALSSARKALKMKLGDGSPAVF